MPLLTYGELEALSGNFATYRNRNRSAAGDRNCHPEPNGIAFPVAVFGAIAPACWWSIPPAVHRAEMRHQFQGLGCQGAVYMNLFGSTC